MAVRDDPAVMCQSWLSRDNKRPVLTAMESDADEAFKVQSVGLSSADQLHPLRRHGHVNVTALPAERGWRATQRGGGAMEIGAGFGQDFEFRDILGRPSIIGIPPRPWCLRVQDHRRRQMRLR